MGKRIYKGKGSFILGYSAVTILIVVVILILVGVCIWFIVKSCKSEPFSQTKTKNYRISNSLTKVHYNKVISKSTVDNLSAETKKILKNILKSESTNIEGNRFNIPSFFYANEKWPGCLPKALYQGTCGSCWGFAAVTSLSSRFYIESCGNTGCYNMPQINVKGYSTEMEKINSLYKFRKIIIISIKQYIDFNNNNVIHIDEWLKIVERFSNYIDTQKDKSRRDVYFIAEILVYMLDFQSLGSMRLYKNKKQLLKRAKKTFYMISDGGIIDLDKWTKDLESQPLILSAEKIIACCESCIKNNKLTNPKAVNDPICMGGTLINAWEMLRDVGTTTAHCSGYNMDSWKEGDPTPSCHVVLGPDYSYCSGYGFQLQLGDDGKIEDRLKDVEKILEEIEDKDIDPHTGSGIWPDPQLNRFMAKNAYEVESTMYNIQKEISERGPVSTGYVIYEDFQNEFAAKGGGGQLYKENTKPVGSKSNSLIYMWDGKGKELGGHAVTIVGWGTFTYTNNNKNISIPYWICLNSWGIEWGTTGFPRYNNRNGLPENLDGGGYFWMIRGINNCGIEENVVAGQPNLEVIVYKDVIDKYGWGLLPPSMDDIKLIPPVESNVFGDDRKILVGEQQKGGSIYIEHIGKGKNNDNTWEIKSMDPPSPFTFFWPKPRPLFCMGNLNKTLSEKSKSMDVNDKAYKAFKHITKVQKNPIFIINDEQIQFIKFLNNKPPNYEISIGRGINLTIPKSHIIDSNIEIFPFRELSYNHLHQDIPFCESVDNTYYNFIEDILKD